MPCSALSPAKPPPVPTHFNASLLVQERLTDCPTNAVSALALNVTSVATVVSTVMVSETSKRLLLQVKVNELVRLVSGALFAEPFTATLPGVAQAPLAIHSSASLVFQLNVTAVFGVTPVACEALNSVISGAASTPRTCFTSVTPPGPVQLKVKVLSPLVSLSNVSDPSRPRSVAAHPVTPPLALQLVASVLLQSTTTL